MGLGKWKPFTPSHSTTKFGSFRSCGNRDIRFLIYYVIQQGNVVKEVYPSISPTKMTFENVKKDRMTHFNICIDLKDAAEITFYYTI